MRTRKHTIDRTLTPLEEAGLALAWKDVIAMWKANAGPQLAR